MNFAARIAAMFKARREAITDAFRDHLINENIDPENRDQAQDVLQHIYNNGHEVDVIRNIRDQVMQAVEQDLKAKDVTDPNNTD
jgi:hypothetical protein